MWMITIAREFGRLYRRDGGKIEGVSLSGDAFSFLYSDKLALGVVDLKHIELANEEDRTFEIDHWARLFKATTWEEIKMIATNNEYMKEATQALYEYNFF